MSRFESETNELKENERSPKLNMTDWKPSHGSASHGSTMAQKNNNEDISPRSGGEIPLNNKQTDEIRRRIEEVKQRAKATEVPSRPASQPVESSATAQSTPDLPLRPNLDSVSPDLLRELRKIIKDEFEQLNKAEKEVEPPISGRYPHSSSSSASTRPWINAQGSAPAAPLEDIDEKKASSTATGAPSATTQPRISPKQSTVRFSDETKPAAPATPRGSVEDSRKPSISKASNVELTAIDQKWGTLFGNDGTPTRRIEHIIQGLAKYIIDEFIPQGSIVVTPEKMAAFYSYHRLDKEVFPFSVLFKIRAKDLNEALAALYEDLECQYFLVPADTRSRPAVPGLTPTGFAHWLVTMIQAYPEEESKRLDKVVSALPIEADSLLDGKIERLPKQISRYLLPEKPIRKSQKLVDEAMREFMEDVNMSSSQSKGGSSGGGSSSSKPTPTAPTQEKRPSTTPGSGASSRYVPEAMIEKNRAEGGGSGHDKDRRATSLSTNSRDTRDHDNARRDSMPPSSGPGPGHLGRTYSLDSSGRTSRTQYASSPAGGSSRTPTASWASSRKSRSPQHKPQSQSVPAGLDRDDLGTDRLRGSATISAVAATVAAAVLGSSSHTGGASTAPAPTQSNSSSETSTRSSRTGGGDFVLHRDKRASLDESTPRASLRDKVGLEGSGGNSRFTKRRSMALPEARGPTWDDYLKNSGPKSATFTKRNDIG